MSHYSDELDEEALEKKYMYKFYCDNCGRKVERYTTQYDEPECECGEIMHRVL